MFKWIIVLSLFFVAPHAFAVDCKGKSKSSCSNSDSCYWVGKFTRKDGASVKAHCRGKAGNASTKKASKKNKAKKKKKEKASKKKDSKVKDKKKTKDKKDKKKKKSKKSSDE